MNKKIVNTKARKDFILNDFIPIVEKFEQRTGLKVHTSGMPYIRTLSAQNIMDEIGLFINGKLFCSRKIVYDIMMPVKISFICHFFINFIYIITRIFDIRLAPRTKITRGIFRYRLVGYFHKKGIPHPGWKFVEITVLRKNAKYRKHQ